MNKSIIIFLLIITTDLFAEQSGVSEYKFLYKKFTDLPKNGSDAEAMEVVVMIAEYAKKHQYILKFNPLESIYYVEISMPPVYVDEFAYKFSNSHFSRGILYQNRETGEVLNEKESLGKNYLVNSNLLNDWKITTETKYIGKYKFLTS